MDARLVRSMALALALHGAGVAAASRLAPRELFSRAVAAEPYEVDLLAPGTAAPEPRDESAAPIEDYGRRAPTFGVSAAHRSSRAGGGESASGVPSGEAAVPGLPSAEPEAEPAPAPERPVDLGLGRTWIYRGLPDRPKGQWQSGSRAAGGLGSGLEARDREKGLGRGGVVASLARNAAIRGGPSEGEATLSVTTDREGRVTSVSLGESRGGSWNDVASALRQALAGRKLRVPPGSNGLVVVVLVRARVQLPSGAKPGHAISGQGAGAEFDVADIGAHPTRVVSARVTNERLL